MGYPAFVSGVFDLAGMKFKDIIIIIFLAGLLLYAACHRAGLVGSRKTAVILNYEANKIDSVKFENRIFSAQPESVLTITPISGDMENHLPGFKSSRSEIVSDPDSSGCSIGQVYVRSDCGTENTMF